MLVSPVIIISCDSHAGLRGEQWKPYFESKYHDLMPALEEDDKRFTALVKSTGLGWPFPPEQYEVADRRRAVRNGGHAGFSDPQRRLKEADADGIAAEILHQGGAGHGAPPFIDNTCRPVTPEIRAAGCRAHNRFMVEYCAADPKRLIGVALFEPWPDMKAAVEELERARAAGLRYVQGPVYAGVPGMEKEHPPLWDRFWEPLWATCVALDMPIDFHAGHGSPGTPNDFVDHAQAGSVNKAPKGPDQVYDFMAEIFDQLFETRRPVWQLMWSGVFDRHPKLKVVVSEIHADWIPATMEYLDRRAASSKAPMKLKPSEYWRRHCVTACTSIRPTDVAAREKVGLETMMFGTDYPHYEGTWPNTLEWLQAAFPGVPERDARLILGENAIRFYGLDHAYLASVAERVGPRPEDFLGKNHVVDPRLIENFHVRSGYHRPSKVDLAELARAVDEDARGVAAQSA
jgi:predicted TIM-barrel fold metal-dependent hydrolase